MSAGRLLVVGTPIGNLGDLSPRAAAALRDATLVACEDTRRTAPLLRHAGSEVPMLAVHEHNEAARAAELVRRMLAGDTVALVTDAGLPVVSDPGGRVVAAAIGAGIAVEIIPGPSAVLAALVLSGLPAEPFTFVGFFPRKRQERLALLTAGTGPAGTVVGFESPNRLAGLLADLASVEPDRPMAVCRELTKLHEEVVRGTAADLAARMAGGARGEVTVVIGPAAPVATDAGAVTHAVERILDAGLSPAKAAELAAALGIASRNAAYREALAAASRRDR